MYFGILKFCRPLSLSDGRSTLPDALSAWTVEQAQTQSRYMDPPIAGRSHLSDKRHSINHGAPPLAGRCHLRVKHHLFCCPWHRAPPQARRGHLSDRLTQAYHLTPCWTRPADSDGATYIRCMTSCILVLVSLFIQATHCVVSCDVCVQVWCYCCCAQSGFVLINFLHWTFKCLFSSQCAERRFEHTTWGLVRDSFCRKKWLWRQALTWAKQTKPPEVRT